MLGFSFRNTISFKPMLLFPALLIISQEPTFDLSVIERVLLSFVTSSFGGKSSSCLTIYPSWHQNNKFFRKARQRIPTTRTKWLTRQTISCHVSRDRTRSQNHKKTLSAWKIQKKKKTLLCLPNTFTYSSLHLRLFLNIISYAICFSTLPFMTHKPVVCLKCHSHPSSL